jgi:hypothetical protein
MKDINPEIKIISYTVKVPSNFKDGKLIAETFEDYDYLIARDKAVVFAKNHKAKINNYKGIQLILNYLEKNEEGKYRKMRYKILTGWRMGTEKIIPHLNEEASILLRAKKEFPKMKSEFENKHYIAVNQNFTSLYYFTFL